jgi:hypothetical protein
MTWEKKKEKKKEEDKIAVWLWFSIPIVKPVKLFTLLKL